MSRETVCPASSEPERVAARHPPQRELVESPLARSFTVLERRQLQFRVDAFNVINKTNLYLPNSDLSLALKTDGTYSTTSLFGHSTRAFDARNLQASLKFSF